MSGRDVRLWSEMFRAAEAGHPTAIEWVWWWRFVAFWEWLAAEYAVARRVALMELLEQAVQHVEEYAIALTEHELSVVGEYLGAERVAMLRNRRSQRRRCVVAGCPGVDGQGCVHTSPWRG